MEIEYVYEKTRSQFGKQCIFDVYGPVVDQSIEPDPKLTKEWLPRPTRDRGVQFSSQLALHEAQTSDFVTRNVGMYHFEGGWPKDVNPEDEEITARYRRRVEKSEEWAPRMRTLLERMEHCVLQNGAVNIYQRFFDDAEARQLTRETELRITKVLPDRERPIRAVSSVSWAPYFQGRIVVSYSKTTSVEGKNRRGDLQLWDIDYSTEPRGNLESPSPATVTEFNHQDPNVLVGGLATGQVCCWDLRAGNFPMQLSETHVGHRRAVTGVKWVPNEGEDFLGEFLSTSLDGTALLWDARQLDEPIGMTVFDLDESGQARIDNAVGVTSVCLAGGLLCGLENGYAVAVDRSMDATAVERLARRYAAHESRVEAIDRNPGDPNVFLTVADSSSKIWSEDLRDTELCCMRHVFGKVTGGCWSRTRHSVFYDIDDMGDARAWDMLRDVDEPVAKTMLGTAGLTTISYREDGALLAVGDRSGNVHIVTPSENLFMFEDAEAEAFRKYITNLQETLIEEIRYKKEIEVKLAAREVETKVKRKREKPKKKSRSKTDKIGKKEETKPVYEILAKIKKKLKSVKQDEKTRRKSKVIKIIPKKTNSLEEYISGFETRADEDKIESELTRRSSKSARRVCKTICKPQVCCVDLEKKWAKKKREERQMEAKRIAHEKEWQKQKLERIAKRNQMEGKESTDRDGEDENEAELCDDDENDDVRTRLTPKKQTKPTRPDKQPRRVKSDDELIPTDNETEAEEGEIKSYTPRQKFLVLREMLAPPTVVSGEARLAREELLGSVRSGKYRDTRSMIGTEATRESSEEDEQYETAKEPEHASTIRGSEAIQSLWDERKETRKTKQMDPCSTRLADKAARGQERNKKKKKPGDLSPEGDQKLEKEYELRNRAAREAQERIYPRISAYRTCENKGTEKDIDSSLTEDE